MNESTELVRTEPSSSLALDLSIVRPPAVILEEAKKAAQALRDVISQKPNPIMFNKEQYLENEDWQLVARFYGVTARVKSTEQVHIGDVFGFKATAEAILVSTGQVIGSGEALCLNDEEKWSTRPKYEWQDNEATGKRERVYVGDVAVPVFQLMSMAQTRALSKALRGVLSWVVVLAGYKPTPAEEMTGREGDDRPPKTTASTQSRAATPSKPPIKMPERKSTSTPTTPAPASANGHSNDVNAEIITDPQRKRFFAIWKGKGIPEDEVRATLKLAGYTSSKDILKVDYDGLCAWAQDWQSPEDPIAGFDDAV